MSGFDDFLDQLYDPQAGQEEVHVIGTTLDIRLAVLDGDGADVDLSSGYTASMQPHVKRGTIALSTFTQTLTGGRQILLEDGYVTVRATPAASEAMFGPYAGQVATITLIVTRTSDGAAVPMFRDCFLTLRRKLNP